jgi:uncharacterized Zn finger protein
MKLTLEKIREYVDSRTYDRGMKYYLDNMLHSTVQMGQLLKGRCRGSMPYSYYVQVALDSSCAEKIAIKSSKCSCPVHYQCKHIAALLIAWHKKPDEFRQQQELVNYFSKQKKAWLIDVLLEFGEKDSEVLERLFKIKDGKARRTRKGREVGSKCSTEM